MEPRGGKRETAGIITPKEEEGRHCTLGVGEGNEWKGNELEGIKGGS